MTIYSDQQPVIEARGEAFVYTLFFEDEKHHVVLTRHAALRMVQLTMAAMGAPDHQADIELIEDYLKQELAS